MSDSVGTPWKVEVVPDIASPSSKKSKIPSTKFLSDDCVVNVGQQLDEAGEVLVKGTPYHVHTGEWVELLPLMTVRAQLELQRLAQNSDTGALEAISGMLAKAITSWNWTDMDHNSMPDPPSGDDLLELHNDEWVYLIGLMSKGSAQGQSKNA